MKVVIVGRRGKKRQVRWLAFLVLAITLSLFLGLGIGGVYFLLCGRWSHGAVMFGSIVGIGIVILGLYSGLTSPLEQLTELPSKEKT